MLFATSYRFSVLGWLVVSYGICVFDHCISPGEVFTQYFVPQSRNILF